MIDLFTVFTRGGKVLWKHEEHKVEGRPVHELIQRVLLEERAAATSYTHGNWTLQWAFDNDAELVFVACVVNVAKLPFVDELLEGVRREFAKLYARDARFPKDKKVPGPPARAHTHAAVHSHTRVATASSQAEFDAAYNRQVDKWMDKAFNRARDAKKPREFSETKLVSGGGGGGARARIGWWAERLAGQGPGHEHAQEEAARGRGGGRGRRRRRGRRGGRGGRRRAPGGGRGAAAAAAAGEQGA
jgi:hypothetical protein